jgi:hypothetical protein
MKYELMSPKEFESRCFMGNPVFMGFNIRRENCQVIPVMRFRWNEETVDVKVSEITQYMGVVITQYQRGIR